MMKNNVLKKKKILIIYPQLNEPYSGGQVIDFSFIQQIVNSDKFVCSYLLDSTLSNVSILGYIYYTLCHIKEIMNNDIIFSNSRLYPRLFPCFLLIKLLRRDVKILVYHHHFNYFTQTGIIKWVHKFFELSFLKIIDVVIIPSPFVKDKIMKILPKTNIEYIEIGFDLNPYLDLDKTKLNNLLFVGTVELRKGVHHLIYLAQFLASEDIDFHINIVGNIPNDSYTENVKELIVENGLERYITLCGRVNAEELELLYRNSDVFVFPSSHEGYGMVLIEALSHSLPVIAFSNSAIPYSIKDGFNGILVKDGDAIALGNKVKELLFNEKLWNELRINAYSWALKMRTFKQMENNMKSFISSL